MTAKDIAQHIGADIEGDEGVRITGVAKIEDAKEGELSFIANPKYHKYYQTTAASALIVSRSFDHSGFQTRKTPPTLLIVDDPYLSFLSVLKLLHPPEELIPPGIHPTAVVASDAEIGPNVRIGAHVIIESGCRIGARSIITHGSVLAKDVQIGEDTVLHTNVSVRERSRIGSNVTIHSGTVIGSDGFGFAPMGGGSYQKIPHTGIVVIEDDVEIGSNCSIDRATIGETKICKGAKLDNLIQVAHNVVIGEDTVIAAQSGIAGSTRIGSRCVIAGQVGFSGHIEIADGVTVAAQSGVSKSITKPGVYFGYPAKEHGKALRMEAALRQLPGLITEFEELKREMKKPPAHEETKIKT